jgi:FdhE protein
MQRVLDPAQIEPFAQRTIPRTHRPDPATLFSQRAQRLRQLAAHHALGEYLTLMSELCEAQQAAWARLAVQPADDSAASPAQRAAQAVRHGMPPLQACGWRRDPAWRSVLTELCGAIAPLAGFPAPVAAVCQRLAAAPPAELEQQADLILATDPAGLEAEAAPFIMAALQVYWMRLATTLAPESLTGGAAREAPAAGSALVCPVCGSLPVASVVRADGGRQGYRYLHCALCATEWHLVRITCSQCLATEGIRYHFIEGGPEAVRAESCPNCRAYRKILYHEKDPAAEPLADDLATVALDLLMSEEGYHRASGNPLLWQG